MGNTHIWPHTRHFEQGTVVAQLVQGSHKLWKSWKTWKITKKNPCMEKSWNLKKPLNNHGKIMELCEII